MRQYFTFFCKKMLLYSNNIFTYESDILIGLDSYWRSEITLE